MSHTAQSLADPAPTLLWSDPTSGEHWVNANDTTLWFRFSEYVEAQSAAGPVVLKTDGGAVVATWDQITREPMAPSWAYLDLPAPLSPDTRYRLEIPTGAAVDQTGNPLASVGIDFHTAAAPQTPGGPAFAPGASDQANTLAAGEQTKPQIAWLADGSLLVVWASIPTGSTSALDSEIRGQRYEPGGAKMGGELLLAQGASWPLIAALEGDGFALTWSGPRVPGDGTTTMFTQRFNGSGQPLADPVAPNTTSNAYLNPGKTVALDGGGYLVVMGQRTSSHMFAQTEILAQRFDADGAKVGGEMYIGAALGGWDVTSVPGGGWAVGTQNMDQRYGGLNEFQTTLFDASGTIVGTSDSYSGGSTPRLATLASGTVLVGTPSQFEMFDASGAPVAPPVDFNPPGPNSSPMSVTALPGGGFLATWKEVDASGNPTGTILAQSFDAAAHPVGAPVQVPGTNIAPTPDGGFLVAYEVANAGTGTDIQVQKFAPQPPGSDTMAPSPIDFFPAAGSNTLPPDWNLAITFDEDVMAGAGTITLRTAGGQVVQTFDVASDPGISIHRASVIINPAADLLPGTHYQLVVAPGAINDLAGNAYAGVSDYGFMTAGEPPTGGDPGAPVAVDFFPAAGSNTLPPDWNLGITFNEAVQAGSGTITLQTAGGQVVQTFATASDPGIRFDGSSVIIDPAADLLPGTSYQLVVSADAVQDLAGNAYAGVSGHSFSTAGTAPPPGGDSTAPAAIDFFPAAGSNTLPPDWSLAITFNEAVQAGSGTITLQTAGGQVVQTFATASDPGIRFDGASVIIDPAADLLPGTSYQLVVSADAVQDLAGNAYAGVSGHSFSTAGSAPPPGGDSTAPAAIDFFPAAGSNTLPADWNLGITFDESVQAGAGTITLQTAAGQVVQTFATASDPGIRFDGASVIIDPTADLQAGTTYELVVSADAIEDLSGNAFAGVSGHGFTTAGSPSGQPDTVAPAVIDYSPAPGSQTLSADGNIVITFDEPVKAGSGSIVLSTGFNNRTSVQHFVAATDPGVRFEGSTLIIDPAADLQTGTQYELTIYRGAVEDLAGNPYGVDMSAPLGPVSSRYTFFTDGPILLGRFPGSKIPVDWNMSLTFNEAVQAGSGTITLETAAGDVVETFVTATHPGIQFSGSNVIINPTADLQAGTTYRLVVSPDAVEDLSGVAYSGVTFWPFTATASQDIVAPTATGFVPAPGSNSLPPDSNFTITFDEPVQAGWGTITLLTAHGDWVQAFATATDAGIHFTGSSLVIDPANNLQPGTDYKLLFGPGAVEDLAGNEAAIPDYFFTAALVGVPPA